MKKYYPFRINKSQDGQFYSTIVSKNGNVLYTSETVKLKQSAFKDVHAVIKICKALAGIKSNFIEDLAVIDLTIESKEIQYGSTDEGFSVE